MSRTRLGFASLVSTAAIVLAFGPGSGALEAQG